MSAVFKLELDNDTKKGFDEITRDLKRLGVEGKDADKVLEGVNKELESRAASDQAKRVKQLADEYDGTAAKASEAEKELRAVHGAAIGQTHALQELDKAASGAAARAGKLADYQKDLQAALDDRKVKAYRDEINKLADEMSGLGKKGAGAWIEFAAKGAVALGTLRAIGEVAKKAAEGINFLAEKGVASMQRLQVAGTQLQRSLVRAFDTKPVAVFTDAVSDMVTDSAHKLNWLSRQAESLFDAMGRLAGFDVDKANEIRGKNDAAAHRKKILDAQEKELANRGFEAADLWIEINLQRRQAAEDLRLAELKGVVDLEKELRASKDRLDRLLKVEEGESKADHDKKMKRAKEEGQLILSLEQRIHDQKKADRDEDAAEREQAHLRAVQIIDDEAKRKENAARAEMDLNRRVFFQKELLKDREKAEIQAQVDSLVNFLRGQGGGQGGGMPFGPMPPPMPWMPFGGGGGQGGKGGHGDCCCCCQPGQMPVAPQGGMPQQWAPPTMPMPPAFGGQPGLPFKPGQPFQPGRGSPDIVGRIEGEIKPADVRKRVLKNRQDQAEQEWERQMKAEGKMDQNGVLLTNEQLLLSSTGPNRGRPTDRDFRDKSDNLSTDPRTNLVKRPDGLEVSWDSVAGQEILQARAAEQRRKQKLDQQNAQDLLDTEFRMPQEGESRERWEERRRLRGEKETDDQYAKRLEMMEREPINGVKFRELQQKGRDMRQARLAEEAKRKQKRDATKEQDAIDKKWQEAEWGDPKQQDAFAGDDVIAQWDRDFKAFTDMYGPDAADPEHFDERFEDFKKNRPDLRQKGKERADRAADKRAEDFKRKQMTDAARRKARAKGMRRGPGELEDGPTGAREHISDEENRDAYIDLVKEHSENIIKTGKFDTVTVQAIRKITQELVTQKTELSKNTQRLDEIVRVLDQLLGRGNNSQSRGQRTGAAR